MPLVDIEGLNLARFSALSATCNKICYNTTENIETMKRYWLRLIG